MSDFTTITKEEIETLLRLASEIEEATNENFYAQIRAKQITKIINKYENNN